MSVSRVLFFFCFVSFSFFFFVFLPANAVKFAQFNLHLPENAGLSNYNIYIYIYIKKYFYIFNYPKKAIYIKININNKVIYKYISNWRQERGVCDQ